MSLFKIHNSGVKREREEAEGCFSDKSEELAET